MVFHSLDLKLAWLVGRVFRPWQRRNLPARIPAVETKPICLITGASSGIGEAIAFELGRGGHNLLLIGRDQTRLQRVGDEVRLCSEGTVITLSLDLTSFESLTMIDQVIEGQGFHVAELINNAGLGERDDFLLSDWRELKRILDVNIEVLTKMTRRYLPGMVVRGEGAVINMASIGGLAPGPYQSVYYASKAYVISLTEALAHETRGRGVYIGAVLPGPTKTKFHQKIGGGRALYLKFFGQMRPTWVARALHRALLMRHWPIVTPGIIFTVLGFCCRVIPGSLLVPLLGVLYKKRG